MGQRILWYWISYFADFCSLSAPATHLGKKKKKSYLPAGSSCGLVVKAANL